MKRNTEKWTYTLQKNGKLECFIQATTFRNARAYFQEHFSGTYQIECYATAEQKNVRLK